MAREASNAADRSRIFGQPYSHGRDNRIAKLSQIRPSGMLGRAFAAVDPPVRFARESSGKRNIISISNDNRTYLLATSIVPHEYLA